MSSSHARYIIKTIFVATFVITINTTITWSIRIREEKKVHPFCARRYFKILRVQSPIYYYPLSQNHSLNLISIYSETLDVVKRWDLSSSWRHFGRTVRQCLTVIITLIYAVAHSFITRDHRTHHVIISQSSRVKGRVSECAVRVIDCVMSITCEGMCF